MQAAFPNVALYVPTPQSMQGPPLGPVDPALHVQSAKASLPAAELDCAGQAVHESPTLSKSAHIISES